MLKLTEIDYYRSKKKPTPPSSSDPLLFIPGIWINGKDYWLQNCSEKVLYDEELVVKSRLDHSHSKVRLSSVYISNHSNETKEVKFLSMYQNVNIMEDNITFISPSDHRIFYLSTNHMVLVNAMTNETIEANNKEFTAIPQWLSFTDQVWSSTQKGCLRYRPLAKGPAASIMGVKLTIHPRETRKIYSWSISGTNKNELLSIEQALIKQNQL